ncbi:hypothetical protein FGB62_22g024 [Gracilaria domingensis]|nr:hypothetical protein FGB62_22g024 [Gracilaria domingensis]
MGVAQIMPVENDAIETRSSELNPCTRARSWARKLKSLIPISHHPRGALAALACTSSEGRPPHLNYKRLQRGDEEEWQRLNHWFDLFLAPVPFTKVDDTELLAATAAEENFFETAYSKPGAKTPETNVRLAADLNSRSDKHAKRRTTCFTGV